MSPALEATFEEFEALSGNEYSAQATSFLWTPVSPLDFATTGRNTQCVLILAICGTKICCCAIISMVITKNVYKSEKILLTVHVLIFVIEMLFEGEFVLGNCFTMTILRIYFRFYPWVVKFALIFGAVGWAEFSSSALIVLLRLMIRFKVIQSLLFHISVNSNSSFTASCTIVWKMAPYSSAVFFHVHFILCVVPNPDEFLTSSASCTASKSVKEKFFLLVFTPFKERWFLHMHIEQNAEDGEGGSLTHTKMLPKIACYLYYSWSFSLLTMAQGCFVVWLPRLKSSTLSKSTLRRLW